MDSSNKFHNPFSNDDCPNKVAIMTSNFQTALGPIGSAIMCNKFMQLESFQDMFRFLWECPKAHECFVVPSERSPRKSAEVSKLLRDEGNNQYRRTNFDDALKLYNLSLMFAPHPSLPLVENKDGTINLEAKYDELACAYANRSAIFYCIKEYEKSIIDIDLALKYGYPKENEGKLLDRKKRCLKGLEEAKPSERVSKEIFLNAQTPPNLGDFNPNVPSFSSALKVTSSSKRGRHVIAARDITPGEVLAVEESYCSLLRFDNTLMSTCQVCLMGCSSFVPCPNCFCCFCSEKCRSIGIAGAHKKECEILPFLMDLNLSDAEITNAARIVVATTFMELKEKLPILQKESKELPPEKLGFDEEGVYRSSEYRSMYHISSYYSKKPNVKLYTLAFYAFVITKVLQESKTFFVDRSGNEFTPSDEDLMTTGTALLYHLAHDGLLFQISDMKIRGGKCENNIVGAALFPSVWLIRHSCNPNAAHYNIGNVRVVRSIVSIPAGSEVTLLYSEGFQQLPLEPRKLLLKARGIDCSCEACVGDWPAEIGLPEDPDFKCVKCSAPVKENGVDTPPKCSGCNFEYTQYRNLSQEDTKYGNQFWSIISETSHAEEKYSNVLSKMKNGRKITDGDFKDMCNYIEMLQKHVALPCKALCNTRQAMIKYFLYYV